MPLSGEMVGLDLVLEAPKGAQQEIRALCKSAAFTACRLGELCSVVPMAANQDRGAGSIHFRFHRGHIFQAPSFQGFEKFVCGAR